MAKEFIKLYFKDLKHVSKGTGEQIAYEYVPDQSNDKQACRVVAERLKEISDEQIERGFDTEMASRSVFEIGQQQFTAMCRSALVKCSDIITSGWQQVYTVCYGVARVVEELRQQPGYPESHRRQREVHIQRFVGPTMQDLGLDVWIEEHGGLVRIINLI